ncbi:histone-fold protein [Artemisia annua]|uniref:Histone-fold protein n=1 Tax=Artemisia annua TaxID=35608 RepID=A0A2U1QD24_ARTAN|nr:histone-fold protein [Artemisia annua]
MVHNIGSNQREVFNFSYDTTTSASKQELSVIKEQDRLLPIANVGRIMKQILPPNAKLSKEAKETMQECVSEFISFVTGEASDHCRKEKRKTVNGDDVCWAMLNLGFDDYAEPLKKYLHKIRELDGERAHQNKGASSSSNEEKDHIRNPPQETTSNYRSSVNICELRNEERVEGAHVTIPLKEIVDVSARFANTLYGYFIGKRLAFPIVENYVKNTWEKFGLERVMLNNGFFLFQFSTKDGMDKVLESGQWLIRSMPIFLNIWTPNNTLAKEEVTSAPVWLKLHNVPIVAYTEVGLSLITTQLGKPIMLDSYTSSMCVKSWGQNSYSRALIEVSSLDALMDHVVVAIPFSNGLGHSLVRIDIEYEWKPPRCASFKIFDHNDVACPKNVKQHSVPTNVDEEGFVEAPVTLNYRWQPISKNKVGSAGASSSKGNGTNKVTSGHKEVSKENLLDNQAKSDVHKNASVSNVHAANEQPVNQAKSDVHAPSVYIQDDLSDIITKNSFGALSDEQSVHVMETDSDNEVDESIEFGKPSTPIVEKIDKLEKLIIDGKGTLVDNNGKPVPVVDGLRKGNPFSKVGEVVDSDSDNEVLVTNDHMNNNVSSAGGYNELEGYLSDDYAAQVLDLPGQLEEFNKLFDSQFQGSSRK